MRVPFLFVLFLGLGSATDPPGAITGKELIVDSTLVEG